MKLQLRIPLKLPYKNELTPSYDRGAFFRYQEVKRTWRKAIPDPTPDQRADGARSLTIVRLMTARERPFDTGNVYVSAAAIIDIIVEKGWLLQDDPRTCRLELPIQRLEGPGDDAAPCTYLVIEDLEGPAVVTRALPGFEPLPPVKRRRARPQGL